LASAWERFKKKIAQEQKNKFVKALKRPAGPGKNNLSELPHTKVWGFSLQQTLFWFSAKFNP
jgi:hypothetical protein